MCEIWKNSPEVPNLNDGRMIIFRGQTQLGRHFRVPGNHLHTNPIFLFFRAVAYSAETNIPGNIR